jgi:hypothetical protein
MHPKSTAVTPESTTAYDPLARQARSDRIAVLSRAQLAVALDALDDDGLAVACRAGTTPVRRAAADVRHARWESDVDEAMFLVGRGWSIEDVAYLQAVRA